MRGLENKISLSSVMQYPKGEEETRRKNETKKGVVDFGLSRFWVVKGVLLRSRARVCAFYIYKTQLVYLERVAAALWRR